MEPMPKQATIDDLWPDFQAARQATGAADRTLLLDERTLHFCERMEITKPEEITAAAFEGYRILRHQQHVAPRTINLTQQALSTFCQWAARHGVRRGDPMTEVRRLRETGVVYRRALTVDECQLLLETSPPHARHLWAFYLTTGARHREALGLTIGDLDFDKCLAYLPEENTKTRQARYLLLGPKTRKMLKKCIGRRQAPDKAVFLNIRGAPVREGVRKLLKRCCARAGIDVDGVDVQALRVTFATLAYDSQADNRTVSALLGHGSIQSGPLCLTKYAKPRMGMMEGVVLHVEKLIWGK